MIAALRLIAVGMELFLASKAAALSLRAVGMELFLALKTAALRLRAVVVDGRARTDVRIRANLCGYD
jgi:hypothetical protein